MVASFPSSEKREPLFSYLKPIEQESPEQKLKRPRLSKRCRWLLTACFGLTQVASISLGVWLPTLEQVTSTTEARVPTAQEQLWHYLGSDELVELQASVRAKQTDEKLALAEQNRLQAQQLRIDAERRAQNLVLNAQNKARQTTMDAVKQADAIRLDASLIGAEQIISANPGDDITLKFAARIQCEEGEFGETATAYPLDPRISTREVRNLSVCFPRTETPAGEAIGEAGEHPIAFFKLD